MSDPAASQELPEAVKLRGLRWLVTQNSLIAVFAYLTVFGSVFLLYLNELGLPKAQIGLLLSLLPFSGLLALGSAAVTTRLGRKRVFLVCWAARKVTVAGLLLLPWVLGRFGHGTGLAYLIGIIGLFAILRALAEAAWYPWIQEVVPDRLRGRFGGISSVLTTAGACIALGLAGQVLKGGHGLERFQILIACGCVAGLLGVAAVLPVPGGAPQPLASPTGEHFTNMRRALADRNFGHYLAGVGFLTVGTLLYLSFLPLFLKQALGLKSEVVVTLETLVMIGGALSALGWGAAADRVGSRPVLMSSLALTLLIPVGWILLPRTATHLVAWCGLLYFMHGVAISGTSLGAGRLLFNDVVPPEENTAYTAVYYAWIGLVGGATPLLAGVLLQATAPWREAWGWLMVDGHSILYAGAVLMVAAGWAYFGRVRPDDRYRTRDVLQAVSSRLLRWLPWRPPV